MTNYFPDTPFPLYRIKDIVRINYGKSLAAFCRDNKGNVPVYGSNGIIGYHSEAITKPSAIIIGRKGSVGEINFSKLECWPIDTSFYIDEYQDTIDSKWLYYCLCQLKLDIHSQGPKPGIKRDLLYNINIPVPEDINEQRRIVAILEDVIRYADEIKDVTALQEKELDVFLQAVYLKMIVGVDWKPLKKVASLVRRKIDTKPEEEYEEMGIRSFGRGTFKKPVLTGRQIGGKRIYRIHEGDLIFSNVFAWEKAIAVAQKEDHGRVGSHRYISFVPHEKQATSEFLCHHFLSERGIEDIRAASPGSAGRNCTLGLKKLEIIKVPVPDFGEQEIFSELVKRRILISNEKAAIKRELNVFNSAVIAKAFRGEL